MSFQAGVFHFDSHPVDNREVDTILNSVSTSHGSKPARWAQDGLFMAYADPFSETPTQLHVTPTGAITFDGRLDNRDDLRLLRDPFIRRKPPVRGDSSDAELALAAYERAGGDGFVSLIGDWSLALFDRRRRQLVLASDFAGVRPLYYSISGSQIRWSTRLRPLACLAATDDLDDEYVAGLLMFGGCPNRTPYKGVFSVPPGHYLTASAGRVDVRPFWKLPVHESVTYQHQMDYEQHLRELFRDAVRCRLRSNAAVLCELSGGFDSSSIACMGNWVAQNGDVKAPALITLSYDHENSVDRRFQEILESFCGFEKIHLSTAEFPFLDEHHTGDALPVFWEQLQLATARVAAERGAGTLVTGSLGDLVMGNWHDDSAQVLRLFRTGHWRAGLRESLSWSLALGIPIAWVLGRAMMSTLPPSPANSTATASTDGAELGRSHDDSIAPAFRRRMQKVAKERFSSPAWADAPPERRKHFRGLSEMLELRRLQPPEALEHLFYTHPYSHRPLVHFMLSIPAHIVCGPGEPRRLMRRAFQTLWPPELRQRRSKDSFGGVFLDSLRPLAAALLKNGRPIELVERGYVDRASLADRLVRVTNSLECNEPQLRQIILLEFWLRGRRMRSKPELHCQLDRARSTDLIKRGESSRQSAAS
jgi:asparagine synthase (glutamine-hydrolysing)